MRQFLIRFSKSLLNHGRVLNEDNLRKLKMEILKMKNNTLSQMLILVSRREERIIDGDNHVDYFMHTHQFQFLKICTNT